MKRAVQVRAPPTPRRERRRPGVHGGSTTLDERALEAVTRFVRVLTHCGYRSEDVGREVMNACRKVPKTWTRSAKGDVPGMDAAAQAVTVWFSDPAYLDSRGNPLPLPLRGANLSLESLLQRVDPDVDAAELLPHLLRWQVLRRLRNRYLPRDHLVMLAGPGGPHNARVVHGLLSMLRTLEHNSEPERTTPGWFEVIAYNRRFPVSGCEAFEQRFRPLGLRLLQRVDSYLHRRERRRKKGERTVQVGVGVYLFEEKLRSLQARRTKRTRK